MKRTLITGANSFVGTSFERYISENFSNDFYIDTIDVKDSTWRDRSFSGFDTIFHVAAIVHIKETAENRQTYFDVNRDLTVEIAKKAKAEGVGQFVFLSSMSVYGLTTGVITKDTKPTPNTAYGISKKEAEEVILALSDSHFKIVVLRPPMIYGSGCKGNYLLLRKLALKLPLFPKVNNNRSMLYIGNLVEIVRLVIENDEEGVFYPQNTEYTNTSEMVKLIALTNHKKVYLVSGFNWILKILSHVTDLVDKAFGDLTYDETMSCYPGGYERYSLEDSIRETERE